MINLEAALRLMEPRRGDAVLIACQESRQTWAEVSNNPELDIPFAGCMDKGSSLGLGIALARPDKKVIVIDGDGSLLMNLGSLVTVAGKAPANFCHLVIENGIYAGTGGQPIPGQGKVSFAELARGAGYASAYSFDDLEEFALYIDEIIDAQGPVFACLKVEPIPENRPIGQRPRGGRRLRDGMESVRATLAAS